MQNTTQEAQGGRGEAQAYRPRKFLDMMAECKGNLSNHRERIKELGGERKEFEKLLEEEKALYGDGKNAWSQSEFQGTILKWDKKIVSTDCEVRYHEGRTAFYEKVIGLLTKGMEHTEKVKILQGEKKVIMERLEAERQHMEAKDGDQARAHYQNILTLAAEHSEIDRKIEFHARSSNRNKKHAEELLEDDIDSDDGSA